MMETSAMKQFLSFCLVGLMATISVVLLTGCSLFRPYRAPVEQGLKVTPKQIEQLKPGMTKTQVRYIMGTPNLTNPFSDNKWYYIYSLQENHEPRSQKELIVKFSPAGKLTTLDGNYASPAKLQYTSYTAS